MLYRMIFLTASMSHIQRRSNSCFIQISRRANVTREVQRQVLRIGNEMRSTEIGIWLSVSRVTLSDPTELLYHARFHHLYHSN